MKNKYDFDEKQVEKIFNIFYPWISAVEMNLDDLIEAMDQLSVPTKELETFKDTLDAIEYIDEFEKIKDSWTEIKKSFFNKVMTSQIKHEAGNPYFIFMQYFQVDELITIFDNFVFDSGKRLTVNNLDIQTVDDFGISLEKNAVNVIGDVEKLLLQEEILEPFFKPWNNLDLTENICDKEGELFEFIIAYEEFNGSDEIEFEAFWNSKTIKLIYELLNRALAMVSFSNFIEEFIFEEDEDDEAE